MTMRLDNTRVSFEEHNEYMRRFRRAHADIAWVNQPKQDELARLDSMQPLQVTHPVVETGGLRFHNTTTNWSAFVPVLKVAQYKLSPN
ncbi:hypothetical protein ES704_04043 [subsurface metagenome]|jgi:hypothetical protein